MPVDHGNKALYIDKSMDLSECKKLIKRKNFQAIKDNEIKKKQEEEKIKK